MARLSPIRARADFRAGPKRASVRSTPFPSKPRKIRVRAPALGGKGRK